MFACLRRLLSFSRRMANVYCNLEVSFHHPAWIWLLQPIWWVCAESCLTLCNPLDFSPSSSSVHWISQARILEWVAISSSRGSSQPRDCNCISYISTLAGGFFTTSTTWEATVVLPLLKQWQIPLTWTVAFKCQLAHKMKKDKGNFVNF